MGYGIDSIAKVKIQRFEFHDTFDSFVLDVTGWNEVSVSEVLTALSSIITSLESSTTKGYVSSVDLSKYPVISSILPSFTTEECYVNGEDSMESYKWVYNILILNLYVFCVEMVIRYEKLNACEEELEDLKYWVGDLYSRLDPSIRVYLVKKGVSVTESVYVGFDTEFTQSGLVENRMVSAQLAVSSGLKIQIPRRVEYKLSRVDEQTNKVTYFNPKSQDFSYKKIEATIQKCVSRVRSLKYGKYDISLEILSESLRMIRGITYEEQVDFITFSLPRTSIQPYFHETSSFSLKEILEVSASIAGGKIAELHRSLIKIISTVVDKE